MHIDLTPEQRALHAEIRAYFAGIMNDERRAALTGGEAGGEVFRELIRQIGWDGWLGVGWPEELLPADHLTIELTNAAADTDARRFVLTSAGSSWAERWGSLEHALAPWEVSR